MKYYFRSWSLTGKIVITAVWFKFNPGKLARLPSKKRVQIYNHAVTDYNFF